MNAKVNAIIERHKNDLDKNGTCESDFENMVREAVKEDVLDEFLDFMLQEARIYVPVDVVTQCLCEHYIPNWSSLTADIREKKVLNILHTINNNQLTMFKVLS